MRCQPHLRGPVVGTSDGGEMFTRKETMDLIRAYYQVSERSRCRLLDLAKSLHGGIGESDAA